MSRHSRRLTEEAARWFTRMHGAEPDHPDTGRFESWLMSDPAHMAEYAAISSVWDDFDSTRKLESLAGALEQKKNDARRATKRMTNQIMGLVVVLASGVLGLLAWQDWTSSPVYQLAGRTGVGEIAYQTLDDGSKLVLNASTQVDVAYYRDRRTVTVRQGEVIFEVTRDASRPFVVDSGHAKVTVLGTRFAVNHLGALVRVSVDHGRVRVESQPAADAASEFAPLILQDGEVAEVAAGLAPQRMQRSAQDAFMFVKGTIVFSEAGLEEIAHTLSRHRKTPVVALPSGARQPKVTALVQSGDVEKFLTVLPKIAPVSVRQQAGTTQLSVR